MAQAEANLASAHANVDAARAAFFPQISLTGQGGFVSTAIGALLQGSTFGYGYGASLLQTIFDGGKLAGQKDLADATQAEFIAAYQSAALNAYADVEFALTQVSNTGRVGSHLRALITAADEAFQISQLQYRQGATDLLNVLQAQQTLFRPRTSWCRRCSPTACRRSIFTRLWAAAGRKTRRIAPRLRRKRAVCSESRAERRQSAWHMVICAA